MKGLKKAKKLNKNIKVAKDSVEQVKNVVTKEIPKAKNGKKKINKLGLGIGCVAGVAVVEAIITGYFYRRTMIRSNAKVERTIKMAGTDWSQYSELIAQRKQFMFEQPHEDVYQTGRNCRTRTSAYILTSVWSIDMRSCVEIRISRQINEDGFNHCIYSRIHLI